MVSSKRRKKEDCFTLMWKAAIPRIFFVLQETFSGNLVYYRIFFLMGVGKAPSFCIPFLSDTDELTAENDLRVTVGNSETHKRFICRISVFHWSHFTGEQHETHQLLPFA